MSWGGVSKARIPNKVAQSYFTEWKRHNGIADLRKKFPHQPRPWQIFWKLHEGQHALRDGDCSMLLRWTTEINRMARTRQDRLDNITLSSEMMRKMAQHHQTGVATQHAFYAFCESIGDLTSAFRWFNYFMEKREGSAVRLQQQSPAKATGVEMPLPSHYTWLLRCAAACKDDCAACEMLRAVVLHMTKRDELFGVSNDGEVRATSPCGEAAMDRAIAAASCETLGYRDVVVWLKRVGARCRFYELDNNAFENVRLFVSRVRDVDRSKSLLVALSDLDTHYGIYALRDKQREKDSTEHHQQASGSHDDNSSSSPSFARPYLYSHSLLHPDFISALEQHSFIHPDLGKLTELLEEYTKIGKQAAEQIQRHAQESSSNKNNSNTATPELEALGRFWRPDIDGQNFLRNLRVKAAMTPEIYHYLLTAMCRASAVGAAYETLKIVTEKEGLRPLDVTLAMMFCAVQPSTELQAKIFRQYFDTASRREKADRESEVTETRSQLAFWRYQPVLYTEYLNSMSVVGFLTFALSGCAPKQVAEAILESGVFPVGAREGGAHISDLIAESSEFRVALFEHLRRINGVKATQDALEFITSSAQNLDTALVNDVRYFRDYVPLATATTAADSVVVTVGETYCTAQELYTHKLAGYDTILIADASFVETNSDFVSVTKVLAENNNKKNKKKKKTLVLVPYCTLRALQQTLESDGPYDADALREVVTERQRADERLLYLSEHVKQQGRNDQNGNNDSCVVDVGILHFSESLLAHGVLPETRGFSITSDNGELVAIASMVQELSACFAPNPQEGEKAEVYICTDDPALIHQVEELQWCGVGILSSSSDSFEFGEDSERSTTAATPTIDTSAFPSDDFTPVTRAPKREARYSRQSVGEDERSDDAKGNESAGETQATPEFDSPWITMMDDTESLLLGTQATEEEAPPTATKAPPSSQQSLTAQHGRFPSDDEFRLHEKQQSTFVPHDVRTVHDVVAKSFDPSNDFFAEFIATSAVPLIDLQHTRSAIYKRKEAQQELGSGFTDTEEGKEDKQQPQLAQDAASGDSFSHTQQQQQQQQQQQKKGGTGEPGRLTLRRDFEDHKPFSKQQRFYLAKHISNFVKYKVPRNLRYERYRASVHDPRNRELVEQYYSGLENKRRKAKERGRTDYTKNEINF